MWWSRTPPPPSPASTTPPPSPPTLPFFSLTTLAQSCALTTGVLLCASGYYRYLRRFRTAVDIPTSYYTRGRVLRGRCVYVGDGDNFRLYHTPGGVFAGWNWLRRVPYEHHWFRTKGRLHRFFNRMFLPWGETTARNVSPLPRWRLQHPHPQKKKLSLETIHIRLCGVDAPESGAFGHPAQKYAVEAKAWLKHVVLGRRVTVRLYSLDQYQRAVAKATVWTWRGPRDVSQEMLRAGWAVVYESNVNVAFGSTRAEYLSSEALAKRKHRGMWQDDAPAALESPGAYKKRVRSEAATAVKGK
ncbi:uncharacterized protein V1518DRAFT_410407 [Limtongia smithiae]|uniref:uncharacterized protein n=1 Tax=Limtongia smithiae TaxID=1125753 RepID=UPI0034CDA8EB